MTARRWLHLGLGLIVGFFLAVHLRWNFELPSTKVRKAVSDDAVRTFEMQTTPAEPPVRLMAMVMTMPKNKEKMEAVRRTWGSRIEKIFIISKPNNTVTSDNSTSVSNTSSPQDDIVELDVTDGRYYLTDKSLQGFLYMYEKRKHDVDWFMKADDDTYVIVENLRHFLSQENSSEPIYFGHIFMKYVKQGYNSGGAGYVLSKEAVSRLHADMASKQSKCRRNTGAEDIDIGKCMEALGVKIKDTADSEGRSRFNCFWPEMSLFGEHPGWYQEFDIHGGKAGLDVIARSAISFHYMSPKLMDSLDFYLYRLDIHGK